LPGVAFWVKHDNSDQKSLVYHPSLAWLKSKGYNTEKAKNVEIGNLDNFLAWQGDQAYEARDEVAYAYQDRISGSADAANLCAAYQSAVSSNKYKAVPCVRARKQRAHALENEESTSRNCQKPVSAGMTSTHSYEMSVRVRSDLP
jgi:hypothetical protein